MDAAEGQQQFNTNNSLLLSVSGAIKNIFVSVRISLWLAIKYFCVYPVERAPKWYHEL